MAVPPFEVRRERSEDRFVQAEPNRERIGNFACIRKLSSSPPSCPSASRTSMAVSRVHDGCDALGESDTLFCRTSIEWGIADVVGPAVDDL
jgi:hypothetical protein